MSEHAVAASVACRNCGAGLVGKYCHGCGEPRPSHHEFEWKHLIHDGIHEFLHIDGKIFRTVWLLITRAGLLTKEYWEGRRTAYIRPLRLYIVIAAIHSIAMSHSFYRMDMFLSRNGGATLTRRLQKVADRTHRTPEEVKAAADRHIAKAYSVLQYLAVLAFPLVPWLIYRRSKPYYVQHFIFSLHVYSFWFLLTSLMSQFLTPEQWMRSPAAAITYFYLAFAIRLLYAESWWTVLWKALILRAGLFLAEFIALSLALTYALYAVGGTH